jgi:Bacterial Ig-like domain (group 3)/FG-GAP-like repeat
MAVAALAALAVTAQPAFATSLLFDQHRPALGFEPYDVRPGDIDGDGIVDLVLGGGSEGGVGVARGNGDGTFGAPFIGPPVTWSDGRVGFNQLALGDINADGRADVVVGLGAWSGNNEVVVLLGRSDGSLSPQRRFASSSTGAPDDLAIGDLNGDGIGDIVIPIGPSGSTAPPESTVSVLLSDGMGGFGPPAEFPAGHRPTRVAVADFNVDGNLDVVITSNFLVDPSQEPDRVSVLLGNGDGTLAAPLSTPLHRLEGAYNMVAADLDGDGNPDLAVADSAATAGSARTAVLLGNGDGTFDALPLFQQHNLGTEGHILATADFNRDGRGDLVVPGLRISMNKGVPYTFSDDVYDPQNPQDHPFGNGLFGLPEAYFLDYSQVRNVTADFDNDGWSDIANIGWTGTAHVLTVLMNRTASLPAISLTALTLDADTVPADSTSGGTVTLSAPAPPGGTIVELGTTRPFLIADLPSRITVAEGQTNARFSFTTAGVGSMTTATIIAQLRDVTQTARLTVGTTKRPTSTSVSCAPSTVTAGSPTTCTATVTDTDTGTSTPTGTISFSSSGSGSFSATSCTLAGSGNSASCSVTYTPTARGKGTHTITASYGGDATRLSSSGSTTVTVPKKRDREPAGGGRQPLPLDGREA